MWRRYLTLVRRDIRRDLEEEVEFHIEARARELVNDGWPEAAARIEARRLFGEPEPIVSECQKIDARVEQRRKMFGWLHDLAADVRFSFRQFRRHPRFWSVIVLTLIVGISASTTIYAVVDGILLQPLPYREPDRLVHVMNGAWKGISYHLSERVESIDLGGYSGSPEVTLSTPDGPVRIATATVSPSFFQVLGVAPAIGRTFSAEEARPGSPAVTGSDTWRTHGVVVLSNSLWQSYFGGDTEAIGRSIRIDGSPHSVIGIMPPDFNFPSRDTALWFPMSIEPSDNLTMWSANAWSIVGRLRPSVTLDSARREIHSVIPTIADQLPFYLEMSEDEMRERYVTRVPVRPLHEQVIGDVRTELVVLLAAIGAVFLILCVNVANLLVARGLGRYRELSTRATLGARRGRLIRQLLVENVTVSVVGGFAGILAAYALLQAVVAFLPADLPRIEEVRLDLRVFAFALVVSLGVGLVFGLLPAIRATRLSGPQQTRVGGGLGAAPRESRISGILVSVELALALVLVVAAALLIQSLWNLSQVETGFRPEGLISARIAGPDAINDELLTRLSATPGITSAAIGTSVPFGNFGFGIGFGIEGRGDADDTPIAADVGVAVTPDYLSTLGIPLVQGRAFEDADRSDTLPVVLVSESLARAHWGDASPIGSRIRLPEVTIWRTIIGVVGNVKWSDLSDADSHVFYLPLSQHDAFSNLRRVIVHTDLDAEIMSGTLRTIVQSLDPDTALSDIRTSNARIAGSIARPRFAAYLLGGFALLALFLAGIGIYGVLMYAMNRRMPEMGVRLALGATNRDVFGLLLKHGLRLTLIGIAIGIPLALAAARLLTSLLFGVEPADPRVLSLVVATLLLIGLAVSYAPARKAGGIDPMVALRHE
jgi:predicted permease